VAEPVGAEMVKLSPASRAAAIAAAAVTCLGLVGLVLSTQVCASVRCAGCK